ncbi:MAG: hypothetical protein Q8K05_18475 [Polaromonas sp.]|jgi:hypothetical protein|uniref:hypothetical protein n=1 Tax=Polaromonas sp. TaxID=1869339 RepID=UPI00273200B3|nr:hypothetical protein [Polaromonas sp.]MDP2258012.1 hypothetical protein [Polaromonas sp.]MDP3708874.1 hypothetical protein [Polaromonas sp.]
MEIETMGPDSQPRDGREAGCACQGAPQATRLEIQALQRFDNAYLLWKEVTRRYEQEMQRMARGDQEAYTRIVTLVRDMAHVHHEFLETSQPLFHARR